MNTFGVVAFTLAIATLSTAIVAPFGVVAAWWLAKHARRGARFVPFVETLLSLPLVLPPTAVGLLLLELLKPRAFVGRILLALSIEVVFTWKAIVIATAAVSFPLFVRAARSAFEEVDPRLVSIARTLGCTPFAAFRRVTLPLAWRGILAGAVLAWSRAIGEFGATVIVAGYAPDGRRTLALAIFEHIQAYEDDRAYVLVGVAIALAFASMWIAEAFTRRRAGKLEGAS